MENPMLYYINPKNEIIVETNASDKVVAKVLL